MNKPRPVPDASAAREILALRRALMRERNARKQAEALLEQKSYTLFRVNAELRASNAELRSTVNTVRAEQQTAQERVERLMTSLPFGARPSFAPSIDEDDVALLTESLASQNAKLESVVASLTDPMLILGLRGELRRYNPAAARLLGMQAADLGMPFHELFAITDSDGQTVSITAVLREGRALNVNSAVVEVVAEAVWRHVDVAATPIRTPAPDAAVVVVLRDLHKRMLAEQQLKDREAVMRAIFDAAKVGIGGLNANHTILMGNSALLDMLDVNFERGIQLTDLVHPDDLVHAENILLGQQNEELDDGIRIKGKDGQWFWAVLSVAPIESGQTSMLSAMFILADISKRKQLEIELRHAQKLESIGRLASGIAHEINTPIQFVGDNAHFLGDAFKDTLGVLDTMHDVLKHEDRLLKALKNAEDAADIGFIRDELPATVSQILDGVSRVSTIVQGMKRFAYEDGGERAPADLNAAITSTLTVAQSEMRDIAHVELELGDVPSTPVILSDLNQVFLNLLVNAAHAVEDAKRGEDGQIVVCTWADATHAYVSIADNGCGIPESIRAQIYDPFFTTKEVGRGTGQGLPLARHIVCDKHAGELRCTSTEGAGTTFVVKLPLQIPD